MNVLAQVGAFEGSLRNALEPLLTPVGAVGVVLGLTFLFYVLVSRRGAFIGGVVILLSLSMMVQENRYFNNTLFTPLQQIRDLSKTITFATLFAVVGNLLLRPDAKLKGVLTAPMVLLFLFETMYLARLVANGETIRGGLGWVADLLILLSFGVGFAQTMRTSRDVDDGIRMFTWASLAFICLNLLQLLLGPREAIAGNRFAGISANPQLAGFVSAVFVLCNAHLFGRAPLASWSRWVHGAQIGVLSLLILWTGSRMSALCCVAGLLMYYRLRLGSFSILLLSGGVVFAAFLALFGDSLEGVSRFVEGENTRREIWLKLIYDFQSSPVFGIMNRTAEEISASESSYLTTLSLMGITGGVPLLMLVLAIAWQFTALFWVRRSGRVEPTQADFVLAQLVILAIGTVFEGFLLGILSFAVVWVYAVLGFTAALLTVARSDPSHEATDGEGYDDSDEAEQSVEFTDQGLQPDHLASAVDAVPSDRSGRDGRV